LIIFGFLPQNVGDEGGGRNGQCAQVWTAGPDDTAARRGDLARFRMEFDECLTARADALFELTDAVLCADGPVRTLVDLTLVAEHRRGHGAMYDALGQGRVEPQRIRRTLASLPLPRAVDGRIVLAVDVSPWLRSDAPTNAERLFCHVNGRARNQAQLIPGWPYSFVAALEPGRTSWTALLDAVRLGPADDATTVSADQLRAVVERLITARHWRDGDPDILIVTDAGYDITRTGRRDYALLTLAIQTGLRVSELTALTCADIHLGTGAHVNCLGKGRKQRITPLTSTTTTTTTTTTTAVISAWLTEHRGSPTDPLSPPDTAPR